MPPPRDSRTHTDSADCKSVRWAFIIEVVGECWDMDPAECEDYHKSRGRNGATRLSQNWRVNLDGLSVGNYSEDS
jgi:hypothetical protein